MMRMGVYKMSQECYCYCSHLRGEKTEADRVQWSISTCFLKLTESEVKHRCGQEMEKGGILSLPFLNLLEQSFKMCAFPKERPKGFC